MKKSALHKEYDRNRIRYSPVLDEDGKVSMSKGKKLGLIDVESYINFNEFAFPLVETITSTDFPAQDSSHIGYTFPLWYMDETIHEKERGIFTIVRWDMEAPNKVILINDDLQLVIVASEDHVLDDGTGQEDELGRPVSNAYIHQIPIQDMSLLGLETRDMYYKDTSSNTGIIIRADLGGETPQVVILEELNEDAYRILTLEETKAICCLYDIDPIQSKDEFWPEDWRNLM